MIHSESGYNVLSGADLIGKMGIFRHPLHPPIVFLNSSYYLVGDGVLRFFLTKNWHFNVIIFDTKSGTKPDGSTCVPDILNHLRKTKLRSPTLPPSPTSN